MSKLQTPPARVCAGLDSGQPKKIHRAARSGNYSAGMRQIARWTKRWSLTLLTEEMRKKEGFETINRESIRLTLKKKPNKTVDKKDVVHPDD